jgi:hypothetical protein
VLGFEKFQILNEIPSDKPPNQSGKVQNLRISLYRYVLVREESRQIAPESYFGRFLPISANSKAENSPIWLEMSRKYKL